MNDQDRLMRLLNDLAASHFQVTAEQRVRVLGVFMGLQLRDRPIHNRRILRNSIGPLLCRSAEEQKTFGRIFQYWFPDEVETPVQVASGPPPVDQALRAIAEERAAALAEAHRRLREAEQLALQQQLRGILLIGLAVLIVSVALQIGLNHFYGHRGKTEVVIVRGKNPGQGPSASAPTPATPPVPQPSKAPTETESDSDHAPSTTPLIRWWISLNQTFGPATALVLLVPLTALAFAAASSRKLLAAYARQTQVVPKKELRNLLSQGKDGLDPDPNFYNQMQPFRRQIAVSSVRDLDVERTIEATVSQAGTFSPVYSNRSVSPEYVVLVDRRSRGDHVANYSDSLVKAMEQAGIHLVTYHFDRDPRRVSLPQTGRVLDLDDVARPMDAGRLLVFSDGERWIDPSSGAPFDWTVMLHSWQQRLLFTWKDPQDWYRSEWLIEQELGLRVLPATEDGLITAASALESLHGVQASSSVTFRTFLPDRSRLFGFLASSGWRWLDEIAPPAEDQDDLINRLREGLSAPAYRWLSALAVYPAVYWSLTLYIGGRIAMPSGTDISALRSPLLEIARLPWLQYARMPTWLRDRLIREMTFEERGLIRGILEQLLLTVTSGRPKDTSVAMDVHMDLGKRRVVQQIEQDDHCRDRILIDFMTRKAAVPADFPIRNKVLRALGLESASSAMRELFARNDLDAMRIACAEVKEFVSATPPQSLRTTLSNDLNPVFEQRDVTEWIGIKGVPVALPRKLCLIKLDPRYGTWTVIDEFSLSLWRRRRRIALRYGLLGFGVLLVALAFYRDYWSHVASWGAGGLVVASIIYLPFLLLWLLLIRPFSKLVRELPPISQADIDAKPGQKRFSGIVFKE